MGEMRVIEGGLLKYCDEKSQASMTMKGIEFIRSFINTNKAPPTTLSIGGLVVMARLASTSNMTFSDLVPEGAIEICCPAAEMPTAVAKIRRRLKDELMPA